eukprot:TRINITY_DN13135_c0_g2_i1.p1 TRINITY_DN13135_c0_g2~~TRINITY_DN13135_c0_g2_i1.p1  ORF type:complete len:197 (-),score=6.86 TRINITY_DN13135_c0_g2_i1:272-862(-)
MSGAERGKEHGTQGRDFMVVEYRFRADAWEARRFDAAGRELPERRRPRAWTSDEDQRLVRAVAAHGVAAWRRVAQDVGRRNADQCCQRWMRALSPDIRKGRWTDEEDAELYARILRHGEGCWQQIAQGIPGRTDIQCRSRWLKTVRPRHCGPHDVIRPAANPDKPSSPPSHPHSHSHTAPSPQTPNKMALSWLLAD